jgi:hypothetical protein
MIHGEQQTSIIPCNELWNAINHLHDKYPLKTTKQKCYTIVAIDKTKKGPICN